MVSCAWLRWWTFEWIVWASTNKTNDNTQTRKLFLCTRSQAITLVYNTLSYCTERKIIITVVKYCSSDIKQNDEDEDNQNNLQMHKIVYPWTVIYHALSYLGEWGVVYLCTVLLCTVFFCVVCFCGLCFCVMCFLVYCVIYVLWICLLCFCVQCFRGFVYCAFCVLYSVCTMLFVKAQYTNTQLPSKWGRKFVFYVWKGVIYKSDRLWSSTR
jgi:hypothetical protein